MHQLRLIAALVLFHVAACSGGSGSSQKAGANATATSPGAADAVAPAISSTVTTPGATPATGAAPATGTAVASATSTAVNTAGGVTPLVLTCAQIAGAGQPGIPIQAALAPGTLYQMQGQFCPADASGFTSNATVLFVVDSSSAMTKSDPTTNGTCGRLAAAEALVKAIQTQMPTGATINVGLIPFAASVTTASVVNPIDVGSFVAQLTAANFCQASGLSNYIAAFQAAQQTLASASGSPFVFFMSDGGANTGAATGANVVQASETAAQSLRTAVPSLTLDGLLLGAGGTQAQSVMTAITGSAGLVTTPAGAANLATAIVALPTLNAASASLNLAAGGSNLLEAIPLVGFTADPTAAATWDFVSEPFTLTSEANSTLIDDFIFQINTTAGTPQLVTFTLRVSE